VLVVVGELVLVVVGELVLVVVGELVLVGFWVGLVVLVAIEVGFDVVDMFDTVVALNTGLLTGINVETTVIDAVADVETTAVLEGGTVIVCTTVGS